MSATLASGAFVSRAVHFLIPPLGLEPHVDFELDPVEGVVGLHRLTAKKEPSLRLFLLDPSLHLPEYSPHITDAHHAELGIGATGSPAVLVVVNPGDGEPTVNLLAPVLLNLRTGHCHQVILADQGWRIRSPLIRRD